MPGTRLPNNVVLPRRLHALDAHLAQFVSGEFADWEFERAGPLASLFPPEDADLLNAVQADYLVFAGDFAGGLLALDLAGSHDVEHAAVIVFDSEGAINLVGTTFDDFLALIAADRPDAEEDSWVADDALRRWIADAGVARHRTASDRLAELAPLTRAFRARFWARLREACRLVRPTEALDYALVLGKGIGGITLGMSKADLDARWGQPGVPPWGRRDGRFLAVYPGQPLTVDFDAGTDRVERVNLFAGRHRAVAGDGTDPMFMSASEVTTWLGAGGFAVERSLREIRAPAAKLCLSMGMSRGGQDIEPWVEGVAIGS